MVCLFYAVGPPGSLFFIMAASIGVYSPVGIFQVPAERGAADDGLSAGLHDRVFLQHLPVAAAAAATGRAPAAVRHSTSSCSIRSSSACSWGFPWPWRRAFSLQRAYWVPVSCLAVIQEVSLRAVWNRQLQRIAGTAVGLLLAMALLTATAG